RSPATEPGPAGDPVPTSQATSQAATTADFTRGDSRDQGATSAAAPGIDIPTANLPRRVRQASLAPQLKDAQEREPVRAEAPEERDADEVRSRMASLQRGWQRGRRDNGEVLPSRDADTGSADTAR
ncbi:histidine kinase, partial [Streptomyces sp. T-3]|nr:histidine kinase [Streptomyces sp. T-3]